MAQKIKWDSKLKPEENANRILPPMVTRWFEAGRGVHDGPVDLAALHRFRLEGKRLRYAMELFEPCYGPGLARYMELLRGAQNALGELNDVTVMRARLGELPEGPGERAKVEAFLEAKGAKLHAEFLKFWKTKADAAGVERRWLAFVAKARPPKM